MQVEQLFLVVYETPDDPQWAAEDMEATVVCAISHIPGVISAKLYTADGT